MSHWDNDPLGTYANFQALDERLDYADHTIRDALGEFDSRSGPTWAAITSDEWAQIGDLFDQTAERDRNIYEMRRDSIRFMP